jgi:HlyD family secretion protein
VATLDLEQELTIREGGWRGRAITFGILLTLIAFTIAALYYFFFREEEVAARATEDVTVSRASINSNLIISGTADAQLNSNLNFQSSGRVATVAVKIGDLVRSGQVLASLESDSLANAVNTGEANVAAAQLKLDDLLDGSSAAELTAAEQAVAQANAALVKAQNELDDVLDGATPAELATAQQAVRLAESQLASAESTLEQLEDGASAADIATAEAAVAQAESALTAAQNSATSAQNTVTSATASLKSAEASYCAADGTPAFCSLPATPISGADAGLLDAALAGGNSALAAAVVAANSTYLNAVNGAASAAAAVSSAQTALDSAEEKLAALEDGASDGDIEAAEAALAAAEAALEAADERLADLQDGATAAELADAQAALDGARTALDAAEARRAEAMRGPEANAIDQARQAVRTAQLQAEAARIRLREAQIVAPYDGTVANVNIAPGEFTSAAAQEPAIVLLTPDRMILTIDVGETDYPNVKLGQSGVALFDGIPGSIYPFTITEIGLSPTVTQGVVTYEATASIVVLPDAPRPAPGMNANGQLVTERKDGVLVIPPRAVRRRGSELVVDVRRDGGVVEAVITTGLSDPQRVEVLTGLNEGDVIVVPVVTGSDGGAAGGGPTPVPTIPGGIR